MKMLPRFIIPLTALFLTTIPAAAQYKYRFEVFGAVSTPLEKKFEISVPQSTVPLSGRQEFSLGARGGVRFGADTYQGHWGQDLIYSYGANSTRVITDAGRFGFTSRSHQFAINALWYPRAMKKTRKVFPYLTAGVGGTFFIVSQKTIDEALDPNRAALGKLRSENVLAFNAGGGLRFKINEIWGVRLDVRDNMSRAPRYGLPKTSTDPNATVFPVGGILHQVEASVSFVYYF